MFLKYPSIENHYQEKMINRFVDRYGDELFKATFIVQEKIHGANIQLIFEPGEEMRIASRNQLTDRGFYNVGEVLDKIDLTPFQVWADYLKKPIHLYGELFGPGIQKGVNYGPEKRILFFDMRIDGVLLSPRAFESFFDDRCMINMTVPVLYYAQSLEQALNTDTKFDSMVYDAEDNEVEGIVIKPYEQVFYSPVGELFYIKKKNEKFKEKQLTKREKVVYTDEVERWKDIFQQYLNEERVESVYSKYGRITDVKDVGKYIGYVSRDANETFLKEESEFLELDLTKQEKKYIMSLNNTVREMLLKEVR